MATPEENYQRYLERYGQPTGVAATQKTDAEIAAEVAAREDAARKEKARQAFYQNQGGSVIEQSTASSNALRQYELQAQEAARKPASQLLAEDAARNAPMAQAQAEVDAQRADQGEPVLHMGGRRGGGFASNVSPEVRQIQEAAYAQAGDVIPQVEERSLEAAQGAEEARQDAYGRARKQVAAQSGKAWGEYHQRQEEQRRAQETYTAAKDEADDAVKAVKETKIDPAHWWHKDDTFINVLTALNGALGGFFSVYTGQNPAMDVINRSIDADIRAQETDLKKKEGVADTLLRRNLTLTKDLDSARERTRLQLLEATRIAGQKMVMESGDADAVAAFQKLNAEIQNRADQATAELGLKYAAMRAGAEGRVQGEYGLKFLEEGMARAKDFVSIVDPTTGELLIEGTAQGGAGAAEKIREKADKVTEILARFESARALRQRLVGLSSLAQNYFSVTETAEYKDLKSQMANLVTDINVLKGQGAISSGDAGRAADMVTNFTNLATSDAAAMKSMDNAQNEIRVGFRKVQTNQLDPARKLRVEHPRTGEIVNIVVGAKNFRNPGPSGRQVQTQPLTPPKQGQ